MLAQKNIEYNWQKSISTVFILSLVGILFFQQFGSILGRWESLGAFERQFRADLVLYHAPPKEHFAPPLWKSLPATIYDILKTHPDIEQVSGYRSFRHRFRVDNSPGEYRDDLVIAVPPDEIPLVYPLNLSVDFLKNIAIPGDAVVTQKFAEKHNVKLGQKFFYDKQPIRVAGIAGIKTDYAGLVVISSNTAALLNIDTNQKSLTMSGKGMSMSMPMSDNGLLIHIHDQANIETVAAQIRGMFKGQPVIVTTPKELAAKTGLGLLFSNHNNKSFLITALFTIFVCALVATQTLRASILSYQDEFAIFLAQGVSIFSLQLVALEMAFWLGGLSTAVAVSAAFVMQAIFLAFKVEFAMSLALIGFVAGLMMVIALFAGLVSCYVITTLEGRAKLQ